MRTTLYTHCTKYACEFPHYAHGLCQYHYQWERRHGRKKKAPPPPPKFEEISECCGASCAKPEGTEDIYRVCSACSEICFWRRKYVDVSATIQP